MPKDLNVGPETVYSVVKHYFKLTPFMCSNYDVTILINNTIQSILLVCIYFITVSSQFYLSSLTTGIMQQRTH
jgi:hypothetical protein